MQRHFVICTNPNDNKLLVDQNGEIVKYNLANAIIQKNLREKKGLYAAIVRKELIIS